MNPSIEETDWKILENIIRANQLDKEPKIMEIGMHRGYSAKRWIESFDPSFFLGIEINPKPTEGYYGNGEYHFWWDSDSHDPLIEKDVKIYLGNDDLDILFIDGDHSLEGVKKDFEMYAPLVQKNGIVILHDAIYTAPTEQVRPFWEELKQQYPYIEMNSSTNSTGIGVIFNNKITHLKDVT